MDDLTAKKYCCRYCRLPLASKNSNCPECEKMVKEEYGYKRELIGKTMCLPDTEDYCCFYCKSRVSPRAAFCPQCGEPLTATKTIKKWDNWCDTYEVKYEHETVCLHEKVEKDKD